ncbi:STAS domain-containing protein [Azovibrio restrictus]|uniref:STAS domain-containing protein n=1 Tax=Azovibrio restrictus TaxID=146938 RepID=UPI0026F2A73E|nr:STAS domain-containing protein [Azovibrio restrictus]
MELEAGIHPKANLVMVRGRIDHGSSMTFSELLHPHLEKCKKGNPPLILDFSGVEYVSSAGLRALMIATRFARNQGGRLGIAGFQPLVREVFGISRFDLVIPCFDTLEAAVGELA